MSTERIPATAGWATRDQFGTCRQCRKPDIGKRRTFCGPACVHEWKSRTDPGYQAREVYKRDKGVCESCGLDTNEAHRELLALHRSDAPYRLFSGVEEVHETSEQRDRRRYPEWSRRCDELGLSQKRRNSGRRLWEMDHRVPVVEGGGSCGLENLRTLCVPCHARVTAELAARRAKARKVAP